MRSGGSECDDIARRPVVTAPAVILEIRHYRVINDRMMPFLLLFVAALSRQYTAAALTDLAHPSLSFHRQKLYVARTMRSQPDGGRVMCNLPENIMNNYAISSASHSKPAHAFVVAVHPVRR